MSTNFNFASLTAERPEEWTLESAIQPLVWATGFCFTCLVIGSFPNYFKRWTAISIFLVPVYGAFQTSDRLSPDDIFNDIYLRFVIILSSYIVALSFKTIPHSNTVKLDSKSTKCPWINGWKISFNSRGVGTNFEVPYLWPSIKSTSTFANSSTAEHTEKKAQALTRHNLTSKGKWSALSIRGAYLILNFILICVYYELMSPKSFLGMADSDLEDAKESIIRRLIHQLFTSEDHTFTPVTRREFTVRTYLIFHQFVPDYLVLSAYHDFFAILFIGSGIDESWEWPPLFGRLSDAWTMRRFWTMFWHRLVYKSYNAHAAVISSRLGIKQGTSFSRVFNNYLVFVLSAIMHAAVTWKFGSKCAWGRSMMYWCVQPFAFVLEGAVQSRWARLRRSKLGWVNPATLDRAERIVGFAWVATWLGWTVTKRTFPLRNCVRK